MSPTRPLAAVTGASSGIGEAFARQLAARGYDLLLMARRRERLEQVAASLSPSHGVRAEVLAADLATEDGVALAESRLADPRLELLVNNAGFGVTGKFWEAPLEAQERMHRLHVMATLRLTHAALRRLVPRGRGAVVNVASVAAFARSLGNVSYGATKSWMAVFTEGLHLELALSGSRVKVQVLCPGFTYSEFHDVMGAPRDRIPHGLWMTAEDVVAASLRGLDAGKLIVIPGWKYRLFTAIITKVPVSWRVALEKRSPHSRGRG